MHPLCLDQGVGVIPWSPLARGRLARGPQAGGTTRADSDAFADAMYTDADDAVVQAVADVAKARGLPPAQVALAWLLQQRGGDRADRRGDEAGPHRGRGRGARRRARRRTRSPRWRRRTCRTRCWATSDRARPRRRGARRPGSGKTTVATGLMAALRRRGHRRGAVQGRARLHRPRLPHARRGPARAATSTRCWSASRPDRAAGPARRGRGGGRRRRGRDGAVRRAAGRRARVDRARRRAARGAGRAGRRRPRPVAQRRRAAARLPVVRPRGRPRGGGAQPGRVAPGTRRCCARPRPRSGCRCSARCPAATALAVPSRHLGLVTAAEHGTAATAAVDAMAELVAAHVDLDAVAALARAAPAGPAWRPAAELAAADRGRAGARQAPRSNGRRAPAGRAAGAAGGGGRGGRGVHLRLRRARRAAGRRGGSRSPSSTRCATTRLPDGTAALVLPGGFPEEHVAALSANVRLRAGGRRRSPRPARRCTPSAAACSTSAPTLDGAPAVRRPARHRRR